MNLLIADDDDAYQRLLRAAFSYNPSILLTFVPDGAAAWWHLSDDTNRFDLCIFDVKMPVVDGIMLIERMRATPRLKDTKVILCTGNTDRPTIDRALDLAVTQIVAKPFTLKLIRERVSSILKIPPAPSRGASPLPATAGTRPPHSTSGTRSPHARA